MMSCKSTTLLLAQSWLVRGEGVETFRAMLNLKDP